MHLKYERLHLHVCIGWDYLYMQNADKEKHHNFCLFGTKATKKKQQQQKTPVLRVGSTFPVGSIGRLLNIFFLSDGKNDSPKNTKISKKKSDFLEKNFRKIFCYFQKFSTKFSLTLTKNSWFYIILAN